MDIKPPTSQPPIVRSDDQTEIEAAQNTTSGEPQSIAADGNAEISANTVQGMKQAGTQMQGLMKTTEGFLRRTLTDQLQGVGIQNEENSAQLLDLPDSQAFGQSSGAPALFGSQGTSAQAQGAAPVAQPAVDPLAGARKEAQALM